MSYPSTRLRARGEYKVRAVVLLTEEEHNQLKKVCADLGVTITDFCADAVLKNIQSKYRRKR